MILFRFLKSVPLTVFFLIAFMCCPIFSARAQVQQVAIIPFGINSEQDLSYLREGISHMLSSRLAWKEKVVVIPEKTILDKIKQTPGLSGPPLVTSIFEHTDANYIVSGSITEFAGTFSLDTAVHTDRSETPMQTFFDQATTPDEIIGKISTIAAQINKSVFNRTTTLIDGKAQTSAKEDLTRANPEKLIPQAMEDAPPTEKPFWQFWKKEKPPAYPDETFSAVEADTSRDIDLEMDDLEEEEEEIKKPFWKFW
ncbi:hypothetical protein SAMN02746065_110105 [Desulfocicer vacuolatum DSM 3385]|uniref:Uncharacterized protein n=1 Tax=Desulfocicer vacuolatum DSM 3385 TaxID=1121400 RepID=A0A1W2C350_9BACT|nr:hypothetical protein [Desulfocicer vacuolatum]SMC79580.1 hypothetical protein SAMN02746065_110105 [Desulfocicer vacuolatum DSM 3385]